VPFRPGPILPQECGGTIVHVAPLAGIEQDVLYRPACFINAQTSHTINCQAQKSAATSSRKRMFWMSAPLWLHQMKKRPCWALMRIPY
jgi:hypothetical protein